MSKVHKCSVPGVCTTTGSPRPASSPLGHTHTHALTVAHTVALTPYLTERSCRAEHENVARALNGCTTRSSARMRNLRRQSHDTRQRGQKWDREGEGCRGQSEGSREVPMVRTPAGPLGSRTPSRGRSQRRDTGRGPAFRCVRISTQIIISSKADARFSRLTCACAPDTQMEHLQELKSAVIMMPVSSFGSRNSKIGKHLSILSCAGLLLKGKEIQLT
jgi:hypothetical protein